MGEAANPKPKADADAGAEAPTLEGFFASKEPSEKAKEESGKKWGFVASKEFKKEMETQTDAIKQLQFNEMKRIIDIKKMVLDQKELADKTRQQQQQAKAQGTRSGPS